MNTLYDEEKDARGVKITWLAETGNRLEDCINFGKDVNFVVSVSSINDPPVS